MTAPGGPQAPGGPPGAGDLPGWDDPTGDGWGYPAEEDAVGSLTAAEAAALAAAGPRDDDLDPGEAGSGMPAELAGLSDQDLADVYAAAWSVPATVAAARERGPGPQWPLSYGAAGYPGGEPPIEALMRDSTGAGGGTGFADGGELDTAPASLLLAGCADEAFQQAGLLDDDSLVGVLRAYRRLASQAQARELALVAELARRRPQPGTPPGPPGGLPARLSEFLAAELAPALTLTGRAADVEVALAVALTGLPVTARLFEEGRVDLPKVRVITDMLAPLSDFHARVVDLVMVPEAPGLTTSELRALLARAILDIDPDAARRRRKHAEKQARVEYWPDADGTATLAGRSLPPAEVLAADQRLTAVAHQWRRQGARGGMDRLRAHAYLALLLGHDTTTPPPVLMPAGTPAPGPSARDTGQAGSSASGSASAGEAGPAGPSAPGGGLPLTGEISLTLPLATLLGLSDAPGDAGGYPQHADTCRKLIDAMSSHPATRWGLIITNPAGQAMAYGGPTRAKPTQRKPNPARGSPSGAGPPPERPRPFGAGGWTITITTEPIAPYH